MSLHPAIHRSTLPAMLQEHRWKPYVHKRIITTIIMGNYTDIFDLITTDTFLVYKVTNNHTSDERIVKKIKRQ